MDGILEELLRLEDAKHRALINLDSGAYEDSVQKQVRLINDPAVAEAARTGTDKLLALSELANINTRLYENLLATAPWIDVASRSYTGEGQITDPAKPGFSAEA
jgi:hypothetical protein